jgi:hypothetical protein
MAISSTDLGRLVEASVKLSITIWEGGAGFKEKLEIKFFGIKEF